MKPPADQGTRERILAAAEAFFAEYGYHGTRLHHIARRVGLQKASLFHYFPSKADLYSAVLDRGVAETEHTIATILDTKASPQQKVSALVGAYVDTVAAHPERTKLLLRQSLGDTPITSRSRDAQQIVHLVAEFIADGQRANIFQPIDPVSLVLGIVGMATFFFTSAPVFAPTWSQEPLQSATVNRVKQHITEVALRCLGVAGHAGTAEPRAATADGLAPRQVVQG